MRLPVHALVLNEEHFAEPAAQLEGADDPVVHQRPDVAVLPRVHCHCRIEKALLLLARDPSIANGLGLRVQPDAEPVKRRLVDEGRRLCLAPADCRPQNCQHLVQSGDLDDCERIWRNRIDTLPVDSPSRCPHGFFTLAYELDSVKRPSLAELLEILRDAPKLTGWNTWWVPTRQVIAPYVSHGTIECWIGGDTSDHQEHRDAAHSDFWRVSPDRLAFLLRGYQEDGDHALRDGIRSGTIFEPTLPIWRVGEGLLHSLYLASRLEANAVTFAVSYTGLRGRRFSQWAHPMDFSWAAGISKDDSVKLSTHVGVDALSANLVEVVQSLLSPLYERFDFTRLPPEIVQRELNRLRKRD